MTTPVALTWALAVVQGVLLAALFARLAPGRTRRPAVPPRTEPRTDTSVTVIVATLNEAKRIGPCLEGLMRQTAPLTEILVVDSRSTDGTRELVQAAAARDPRIRLITDDPLPAGWVGKVWALETGLRHATGEWVLGIDADTEPQPGMLPAIVDAAEALRYDVVSFGPRFAGQTESERFVQPAMLLTLVYRCGAAGAEDPPPDRVMANGQCFLARRSVLEANGGYAPARASFCDDVTLARHIASHGGRVGFLDGSRVIQVRAYASLGEMWREWGRSFDLKDATPMWRRWFDVALVWSTQALPIPVLATLALAGGAPQLLTPSVWGAGEALAAVNLAALLVRLLMLVALRGSYAKRGWPFWLSFLADIPAAVRLTLSTARQPKAWRGRAYAEFEPAT
jgi:dolichol-phosphate mannosyltransferase